MNLDARRTSFYLKIIGKMICVYSYMYISIALGFIANATQRQCLVEYSPNRIVMTMLNITHLAGQVVFGLGHVNARMDCNNYIFFCVIL